MQPVPGSWSWALLSDLFFLDPDCLLETLRMPLSLFSALYCLRPASRPLCLLHAEASASQHYSVKGLASHPSSKQTSELCLFFLFYMRCTSSRDCPSGRCTWNFHTGSLEAPTGRRGPMPPGEGIALQDTQM